MKNQLHILSQPDNHVINDIINNFVKKEGLFVLKVQPFMASILKRKYVRDLRIDTPSETSKYLIFPRAILFSLTSSLTILLNRKKLEKYKNYKFSHAHFVMPDGIISKYLKKKYHVPYVVTMRATDTKRRKFLVRYVQNSVFKYADKIHITAPWIKNYIPKKFWNKVVIIPHGIYPTDFSNKCIKNKNSINVVTVSSFIKRKHVDWIIDCFKNIRSFNCRLTIIGNGPEEAKLKQLGKNNKNIVFLGHMSHDDVIEQLSKTDIFVLPSYDETFGLVYLEAMANKNAVIAYRYSGIGGLFKHGKEAVYVKNKKSLDRYLNKLIIDKDFRQPISLNSYKKVKEGFLWNNIFKKYENLYESLVNNYD